MKKDEPKSVLDEAKSIIHGKRRDDYGPATESFNRIAIMWGQILGMEIKPREVALCMVALKICRDVNKPQRDNLVDVIGYASLAEML